MLIHRLHSEFFLACVLGIGGCASSAPEGGETSPGPTARSLSNSVRVDSASQETRKASSRDDVMEALRAAYVEGAYEEVVRRARKWRRDSLDAATAIQVNTLLGRAEQARERHGAAIEALRTARVAASEQGTSVVPIDRALGESYVALYRWPQAALGFRRVLNAEPGDRAARQALAEVYRESRQWAKARTQYTRLVRTDSSNGQWWARLAQCNLELNRIRQAQRHFAEAHKHLPQSADVALSLSRLYRARGQLGAAQRVVDSTLSHQPGDPRLWRRRADLAFERDALATGDSSATVYRRVGLIDIRRQQYARALPFLRQSLRQDSTHDRTTLYLGVAFLKLDSLRRATTYLQRTVDRVARGPLTKALEQLGTTHSERGRVVDAVRAYKTALRLRPDRATLYFHLATVYDEHYRDKTPAARYYRRFLGAADRPRPELRRYAESRLEALRSTLHMQTGTPPSTRGPTEDRRASDDGG